MFTSSSFIYHNAMIVMSQHDHTYFTPPHNNYFQIQLHNASRIYLNMTFLHSHIYWLSNIFGALIPLLLIRQWKKRAGNRICKGPRVGNWTLVNGSVVTLHVSAPTTRLSAPTHTVTFNRIGIIFIWIFSFSFPNSQSIQYPHTIHY